MVNVVWIPLSFVLYIANIYENWKTQAIHDVYNLLFRILLYDIISTQSSDNNGPFGNYRKIAKVDELFEAITTVHQDQLVHYGVLKTYKEVFFEFVLVCLVIIINIVIF